jgi:hypothetical protein
MSFLLMAYLAERLTTSALARVTPSSADLAGFSGGRYCFFSLSKASEPGISGILLFTQAAKYFP